MSGLLARDMLESVFEPGQLVTAPEEILGPVTDADAREVMRALGLPVWDNPWFDMDDLIGDRLEPVSAWDWELSDRYDDVPEGADGWISLALFPYDDIVFDPATGQVHCLPDDAGIYLVNSSLRAFVHFQYLLKAEQPFYDPESQRMAEREVTRDRLREAMASVDPAALEHPASCWQDILTSIVDLTHRY